MEVASAEIHRPASCAIQDSSAANASTRKSNLGVRRTWSRGMRCHPSVQACRNVASADSPFGLRRDGTRKKRRVEHARRLDAQPA
jgi:hypothetical protein